MSTRLARRISGTRTLAFLFALTAASTMNPGAVRAGSLHTVCATGCGFTSIASAVAAASSGDTVLVQDAVHTEASIVIEKNLTLRGRGRDKTVVQAAVTVDAASDRILHVRSGASVFLEDMTLRHGNVLGEGGAVRVAGSPGFTTDLTVRRLRVVNNRASVLGGGLLVAFDANARVFESIFEGNEAATGAGLGAGGGELLITDSLVRANTAARGGGVFLANGTLTVRNTTIVENAATIEGGALFAPNGVPDLRHVTIVDNTAPVDGGISFLAAAVTNTVIANNPGGDCDGPITGGSLGNWDSDGSCGVGVVGSGDPRLEPLRDNGGPTWTLAPQEESPLLDAGLPGVCLSLDQRGLDRSLGGADCDIGAYERYGLSTCQSPMAAIPDNDPGGFTQTVPLQGPSGSGDRIIDVNASLWANHTWVGDLRVDLAHDQVTVALIDQPGVPATTFGCGGDNILASLDSSAVDPVEDECEDSGFAIRGRLRPNALLGGFRGRAGSGDWTFTIADRAADFTGTLLSWCVYVELFDAPPVEMVFEDGFETGDVSAWNDSMP